MYDIVRNGNGLALGIFLLHCIHGVYKIPYMPLCKGLLYIIRTNRVYLLNIEHTVSGIVYNIREDGTVRLYRNFEKQRSTSAAELPRRAKASTSL
jgi:hypothetical protein